MLSTAHLEMLAPTAPKFVATLGEDGWPNVVPVLSVCAGQEPSQLLFGEFMINKTRRNLEADPHLVILVMTQDLRYYAVRGSLVAFQRAGPAFDLVSSQPLFRYNPYTGLRTVGIVRVEEASPVRRLSAAGVAASFLWRRLSAAGMAPSALGRRLQAPGRGGREAPAWPPPVREKFARLKALKVLAWRGEHGYPVVVPDPAMIPSRGALLLRAGGGLTVGTLAAAAVLTADPVAYQVKGHLAAGQPFARLEVTRIYSACPPLPGELIWRADGCRR